MKSIKFWLYRLQQRLHITRSESMALLTVVGVLVIGVVVQAVYRRPAPPPTTSPLEVQSSPPSLLNPLPGANRGSDILRPVPTDSVPSSLPDANRVDLNTASVEELKQLPGIGPVLAERIIRHRADHGPFQQVDELTRVRGIGVKTLAQLDPLVQVEDATRNVRTE